MRIVLIGIQGSGKSTQGNMLSGRYGIPYLSTGHIFRELAKGKTKTGRYIKETMSAGYLIPDEKTLEIVGHYLKRKEYNNGYVLDGFPRTVVQAEAFKEEIDKVVYLRVSDEEALRRLTSQGDRPDNTSDAIQKRIEQFHELTEPVIHYYGEKGLLAEVDGEKSIEEVHENIMKNL